MGNVVGETREGMQSTYRGPSLTDNLGNVRSIKRVACDSGSVRKGKPCTALAVLRNKDNSRGLIGHERAFPSTARQNGEWMRTRIRRQAGDDLMRKGLASSHQVISPVGIK